MKKVFVAMSGGVDSSVSAALLKKAGYDVVGVYMKQWAPAVFLKECPWKEDRQDALRAAAQLGIPFLTWDFSKEYEKQVGKYMVESYKKGITPNPDVMCNKVIKFGLFYDKAMKEGADFVATGHYVRTSFGNKFSASARLPAQARSSFGKIFASQNHAILPAGYAKNSLPRSVTLLKAVDLNKDQSYFLYQLKKEQLPYILFPVGELTKPEVRKLAKKLKLHNAEKKDSQGVCFVGNIDMKLFLQQFIKPKKGNIMSLNGELLGQHDGAYYYTIGQRHGLNIQEGAGPYFVADKNIKKNIIYVGSKKELFKKEATIQSIHWIEKPQKFPISIEARLRYRSPLVKAILHENGNLVFSKAQAALAPGQSAVFYQREKVLGGGIIV